MQQFTGLGTIADDEIWQTTDEGDFKPFRRCVQYEGTTTAPLADLRHHLHLTAEPGEATIWPDHGARRSSTQTDFLRMES